MQQEKCFIALWLSWSNSCECGSSTSSARMNAIPTSTATFILLNYFWKLPPFFSWSLADFFFPRENKQNMAWPSFFLWLACSSPFPIFSMFREAAASFFSLTSTLPGFLYHSSLLYKLIPILHITFHYLSRGCKRRRFHR